MRVGIIRHYAMSCFPARLRRRGDLRSAERRKRRSPRGLRHPLLKHNYARNKVVRAATALERPSVGHGRARGNEPARTPLGPPGQYEALTNDEPRHQPARPETRPNQRLYVPLGSPPSFAVSSSSARAAHRSRAPQIDVLRMTSIAARVKTSRCDAGGVYGNTPADAF